MEEKLISVIIPVYKVEKYLDKCVESVVNQTYKNLEVILVDDGSPDNCPKMCDELAKKDDRIKVIHKENGGLSDARNKALDICTGDYIMFLDSDDYVDISMCQELLELSLKYEADVVIGSFVKFFEDENICIKNCLNNIEIYEDNNKYKLLKNHQVETVIACGKLYKKEIFKDIRYPVGKIHEDEFVVHRYLWNANKIVYTNKPYYFYLQRNNSITKVAFSEKNLNAIEAFRERIEFLLNNKASARVIGISIGCCLSGMINYVKLAKNDVNLQNKVIESYKQFYNENKQYLKYAKFKTRVKILLFNWFPFLFK